jgi:cellulose synthase (UDP-forming)
VQELFYRSVQVSRQGSDGAICVGSCAVYRREALESNGGTTLIEHSEDVHTGFDLRGLGWDLRYVPIAVSTGVCPDSAGAFFNQQYRWCSGSMSLLGSKKFWDARIRFSSRLCYLSGFFYYIHTALFTFAAPVIPIVLLLAMPDKLKVDHLLMVLPSIVYTAVIFPLWHKSPYRLEAWAARLMYGWAHFFAIWDILRKQRMGWQPTGSSGAKKNKTRRFWVGLWVWSGGTAVVWVGAAVWRLLHGYPPDFALVLASGLFYILVVARVLVQPRAQAVSEIAA